MRKFTIYDSDRYLLDLNEELKVQENKIGSNSYKLISSFFDNLQILLDKLNESEYWEKGWNGYQDFEDSLSKLSRKEINFINQMLADLNFEVSFNKQSIKSEFRELLRNKRKSFSKRGLNDSSFDSSWGNNNSDDVLFDDEFEQDDWGVQKRESRSLNLS